jgi:hypothetical protein
MKIGQLVAQGDVVLVRIAKEKRTGFAEQPRDAHGRIVLAYGETSGHAHVLRAQGVCLLRNETSGERILRVLDPCDLLHDMGAEALVETGEHLSVALTPGDYRVIQQCEWVGQGVARAQD